MVRFTPRKRTSFSTTVMSALCQKLKGRRGVLSLWQYAGWPAVEPAAHGSLQSGAGRCGGAGMILFVLRGRIASRVSFDQNFGKPISFKQEVFQYNPVRDGDRPAFTACAMASMSCDSG